MKTKAVRIYGKNDLRLEEFELPPLQDNEILAHVISDSICMSSYKAALQGSGHKRIPNDIATHPTMIGHEFCGELVEVGTKWKEQFKAGQKFSIQPALNHKGSLDAPGYSFRWLGGNATYVIMPNEVMACGCLLPYQGEGFFPGSLAEPMSCIAGAFHASYHTTGGSYVHEMGIKERGAMAILAGAGPMGLAAIDYAIHCERRPGLLVVTDIDQERLARAELFLPPAEAGKCGVKLMYLNTADLIEPEQHLLSLNQGLGFDDVLVFAPVKAVVEMGDRILGRDGCLNFFAGPSSTGFRAEVNFYNVHYGAAHLAGTSGGNTDDMVESLDLMAKKLINPAVMVTHIGGLDSVIDTTLNLPHIPGGKKLVYTNINMELTAIADFRKKGGQDERFLKLAEMAEENKGLWSVPAEKYLLENF